MNTTTSLKHYSAGKHNLLSKGRHNSEYKNEPLCEFCCAGQMYKLLWHKGRLLICLAHTTKPLQRPVCLYVGWQTLTQLLLGLVCCVLQHCKFYLSKAGGEEFKARFSTNHKATLLRLCNEVAIMPTAWQYKWPLAIACLCSTFLQMERCSKHFEAIIKFCKQTSMQGRWFLCQRCILYLWDSMAIRLSSYCDEGQIHSSCWMFWFSLCICCQHSCKLCSTHTYNMLQWYSMIACRML